MDAGAVVGAEIFLVQLDALLDGRFGNGVDVADVVDDFFVGVAIGLVAPEDTAVVDMRRYCGGLFKCA